MRSASAGVVRLSDHRQLDLDQFNLDVVFGRSGGRIIWQPRIAAWYNDKLFANEPLPSPYEGMTLPAIYRSLGCTNRCYYYNSSFVGDEDPRVRRTRTQLNATDHEIRWDTPVGSQRAVYRQHKQSPRYQPLKWPISDEHDMKVATWRESRRTWRFDQGEFDRVRGEWGGLGAPTMFMPRVNIQSLYINDMGVEAAVYALYDYTSTCEAYFEALEISASRLIDVLADSPVHIINFGDNVHGGTTPPKLFEKYILPVYQHRTDRLRRLGKFTSAHWDGDTKPLLRYARETGLDGIEAITPKPQGDVTLEEAKAALGDMFLLDGIPAVYFDHTYSEKTLLDSARKVIDLFAPNLILGISDEISSHGDIERVRLIGDLVDDYNASGA